MKKKRLVAGICAALLFAAAILVVCTAPKWSEKSFDAVVQETVTMQNGETRLIVERTTEIYDNPMNALCIGADTKLENTSGQAVTIQDFRPGCKVHISLKDAFIEETPFYYPTVYKVQLLEADR